MQQASKEAGVLVFRVDLEYIQPTIMAVAGLLAGRYSRRRRRRHGGGSRPEIYAQITT
jgi:hypothetical protein